MKKCPFQNKQVEIKEARCIIPLLLTIKMITRENIRKNSWFCEFYDKEHECLIVKRMEEEK